MSALRLGLTLGVGPKPILKYQHWRSLWIGPYSFHCFNINEIEYLTWKITIERSANASIKSKFPVLIDLILVFENTMIFIILLIIPTIIKGKKHHLIVLIAFLDHSISGSSVGVGSKIVTFPENLNFSEIKQMLFQSQILNSKLSTKHQSDCHQNKTNCWIWMGCQRIYLTTTQFKMNVLWSSTKEETIWILILRSRQNLAVFLNLIN